MLHDPKFGSAAQTPAQRAWVLEQMQRMIPSLRTKASQYAQQVYARYVAGELSWTQMRRALDTTAAGSVASGL